uniref:Transposase Helix-turn-helix domain-containing protein n=1 Tax=Phlebotomus papatasi TaxID=29031 RepID=A0A1B0DF08_PHLPP
MDAESKKKAEEVQKKDDEDLQHRPNPISTRLPVPPEKQVALTVYRLASFAEYRVVGDVFGIHKSTVCQYFHRVVKCINRKLLLATNYWCSGWKPYSDLITRRW